ncbi:TlpA family protein disulfide reductase [Pseudoflavitalea sp. X16]|uniref:TlpA family protein disulfide reductase n=1 Tax=Paraflavitalea devenefica TaxID=2716334 RepID=UPI001420BCD5|nr:TlpA disulfide reductase family protein [Paraflavitalea devenefica]NII24040.1 TlpA family protein disulfide reductase [Paraflavitalea devenefica]
MKNIVLFFLAATGVLSLQAQPQKSLNAFSKISLAEKPFTLTGTFVGYNPAVDSFRFCEVIYNHLYKDDQQTHVGEIDKDGRFSITFPLNRPQEIMFSFMETMSSFYAIPGSSLDIQLDLAAIKAISKLPFPEQIKLRNPLTFTGTYAQLNKELNAFRPLQFATISYVEHYPLIDSLDQTAYKAYRLGVMQRQLDTLAAFNQRNNTSSEFRQYMIQHLRYHAAEDLLRYRWMHGRKTKQPKVQLTPEYLDFLDNMTVNNEEAVITENYGKFLNEYNNFYNAQKSSQTTFSLELFVAYLKQAGKPVTAKEEQLFKKPAAGQDQIQLIESFLEKYQAEQQEFSATLLFNQQIDSLASHIPPGIGRDIIYAQVINEYLNTSRIPLTNTAMDKLSGNITNANLRLQVIRDNERLRNVLAGKMTDATHVRTALQVSSDKFFDELVKPYKGKVVYIDFWAPWCGPCMSEMPESKVLQRELAGKDVVFLYIGLSCTKQSWENTIKDKGIEGEHYFANDNDGKLLSDKFNVSGIPHYVLVDKNGKVADDKAMRPSDKTRLLKKINSLLK